MRKYILFLTVSSLVVTMSILLFEYQRFSKKGAFVIDQDTHRSCLYGANRVKKGFVGTKFENWNFYESCVLNISCSNPTQECPTQEIHDQSAFFVRVD